MPKIKKSYLQLAKEWMRKKYKHKEEGLGTIVFLVEENIKDFARYLDRQKKIKK